MTGIKPQFPDEQSPDGQFERQGETVDFDHIKRHYYYTHDDINPTRIVPIGPLQDLTVPHGRERLRDAGARREDGAQDITPRRGSA